MKYFLGIFLTLAVALCFLTDDTSAAPIRRTSKTGNLCFNGTFDHTNSPLEGWTRDYAFDGNSHYMNNHAHVSAVDKEAGKNKVAKIGPGRETKIESLPIKYEQGWRYTCTMDIKGSGMQRTFFRGYKWAPGVMPTEQATTPKLRHNYNSSLCKSKVGSGWSRITFSVPEKNASALAYQHLRYVRWLTVRVLSKGTHFIDNVKVTRTQMSSTEMKTVSTRKKAR